ncbi:MAG: hypothetical protein JWO72_1048 [Caulobacteraceae bacterium]|nr:hypothetical protein [Caulobacteraceae bacterium]
MTEFPDKVLSVPDRIEFANEPIRYDPVGRCIYCGEREPPLDEEHIVPYGLAKNSLILPRASCRRCGAITGKFEQDCLRGMMGPLRTRLQAPTRKKKDRKPSFPINRIRFETLAPGETATSLEPVQMESSDYPLMYVGLLLDKPGLLMGLPVGTPLMWNWFHTYKKDEVQPFLENPGDGVRIGSINPGSFARMLAKMAYSYAVAVRGMGSFRPLILDLIFGKTDGFRSWVGGDPVVPEANEDEIHSVRCRNWTAAGKEYVVVSIRLFGFLGTPIYHVVVGELWLAP